MTKKNTGAIERVLVRRQLARACAEAKYYGELSQEHRRLAEQCAARSADAASGARRLGVVLGMDADGRQLDAALGDARDGLGAMRDEELERLRPSSPMPEQAPAGESADVVAEKPGARKRGPRKVG